MTFDLYSLSPSLKHCDPIDTIGMWYLNKSYACLINPLNEVLYIELFNETLFNKKLTTSIPSFTYQHDTLEMSSKNNSSFPPVVKLHDETNNCLPSPLIDQVHDNIATPLSPRSLHKLLTKTYYFSFIQYKDKFVTYRRLSCYFLLSSLRQYTSPS